jgi:hypothetical protein
MPHCANASSDPEQAVLAEGALLIPTPIAYLPHGLQPDFGGPALGGPPCPKFWRDASSTAAPEYAAAEEVLDGSARKRRPREALELSSASLQFGLRERHGRGVGRPAGHVLVPLRAVGQLPVQPAEALAFRLVAQRQAVLQFGRRK